MDISFNVSVTGAISAEDLNSLDFFKLLKHECKLSDISDVAIEIANSNAVISCYNKEATHIPLDVITVLIVIYAKSKMLNLHIDSLEKFGKEHFGKIMWGKLSPDEKLEHTYAYVGESEKQLLTDAGYYSLIDGINNMLTYDLIYHRYCKQFNDEHAEADFAIENTRVALAYLISLIEAFNAVNYPILPLMWQTKSQLTAKTGLHYLDTLLDNISDSRSISMRILMEVMACLYETHATTQIFINQITNVNSINVVYGLLLSNVYESVSSIDDTVGEELNRTLQTIPDSLTPCVSLNADDTNLFNLYKYIDYSYLEVSDALLMQKHLQMLLNSVLIKTLSHKTLLRILYELELQKTRSYFLYMTHRHVHDFIAKRTSANSSSYADIYVNAIPDNQFCQNIKRLIASIGNHPIQEEHYLVPICDTEIKKAGKKPIAKSKQIQLDNTDDEVDKDDKDDSSEIEYLEDSPPTSVKSKSKPRVKKTK